MRLSFVILDSILLLIQLAVFLFVVLCMLLLHEISKDARKVFQSWLYPSSFLNVKPNAKYLCTISFHVSIICSPEWLFMGWYDVKNFNQVPMSSMRPFQNSDGDFTSVSVITPSGGCASLMSPSYKINDTFISVDLFWPVKSLVYHQYTVKIF